MEELRTMKHYHPTFDEFIKLTDQGNTVPVYRELLADALTPVMAYQRVAMPPGFAPAKNAFLLESVVGGERIARYSFVGADPHVTFTVRGNQVTTKPLGGEERTVTSDDPLAELAKLVDGQQVRVVR